MSIFKCIENAEGAGWITKEQADEIRRRFRELTRMIPRSEDAAKRMVEELEAEVERRRFLAGLTEIKRGELTRDLLAYRDRNGRQDVALGLQYLMEHHGQARFGDIQTGIKARLGSVHAELDQALHEFRKGAVMGDFRRKFGETKLRLDNLVHEMLGEDSGDAMAKGVAKIFADVNEKLRQQFNAAGGSIGKLEGGYIPQSHDPRALLNAKYDTWREFILPLLDREKMRNPLTGGVMTDADLERGLRATYDRVTTDGWIDREPFSQVFGKDMLAHQHSDHRFIHFKDADAYLKYQREFGHGDPFAALMGHINTMVRDTVIMERLGPDPKAMMTYIEQWVTKHAATAPRVQQMVDDVHAEIKALRATYDRSAENEAKVADIFRRANAVHAEMARVRDEGRRATGGDDWAKHSSSVDGVRALQDQVAAIYDELGSIGPALPPEIAAEIGRRTLELRDLAPLPQMDDPLGYARKKLDVARRMFELIDGTANSPADMKLANGLGAVRNFITATSLGSATLSAVTDLGFQAMARRFNGLPVASQFLQIGRQFSTASTREAVRAGLIMDSALNVLHTQARYAGSISSSTVSGFLADRVLATSGLLAWTQAGKHAFGLELQGFLADHVGHEFAKLPSLVRRMLDRHGFDAAEWNTLRMAAAHSLDGSAGILRPKEVAEVGGQALAEKYLALILRETTYAVPEVTIRARAAMTGGLKPGTAAGELIRFGAQFKSFGVTVAMMQASRIAHELAGGGIARGAMYGGALLLTTGLLGGVALQLKEIAGGRTLRDGDPTGAKGQAFWGQALVQGGGLGIYGDFLFADVNRFGGSLGQTVAGPVWDRVTLLRNLSVGNAKEAFDRDGKKTNAGRELVSALKQNVPGGSLWYARLAWERIVLDQLQYLIDADAHGAFHRRRATRKREIGNDFWWKPGELMPGR